MKNNDFSMLGLSKTDEKSEKNGSETDIQHKVDLKTALGRLRGRFWEDFGGPGRSWGGKREAKRRKKATKKESKKKAHFWKGSW